MVPQVQAVVTSRQVPACLQGVHSGRLFIRRIFELLKGTMKSHYIQLNLAMCSDLASWDLLLESWNGASWLSPMRLAVPDCVVYTDVLGSFSCGAVWCQRGQCQLICCLFYVLQWRI